jgi:hypothetical protein
MSESEEPDDPFLRDLWNLRKAVDHLLQVKGSAYTSPEERDLIRAHVEIAVEHARKAYRILDGSEAPDADARPA